MLESIPSDVKEAPIDAIKKYDDFILPDGTVISRNYAGDNGKIVYDEKTKTHVVQDADNAVLFWIKDTNGQEHVLPCLTPENVAKARKLIGYLATQEAVPRDDIDVAQKQVLESKKAQTEADVAHTKSNQGKTVKVLPVENGEGFIVKIGEEEFTAKDFDEVKNIIDTKAKNADNIDFSALELKEDICAKPEEVDYSKMSDEELIKKHDELQRQFFEEDNEAAYYEAKKIRELCIKEREGFKVKNNGMEFVLSKDIPLAKSKDISSEEQRYSVQGDDFAPKGSAYKTIENGESKVVNYYDGQGHLIRGAAFDHHDSLLRYKDFEYDTQGNKVKECQYDSNNEKLIEYRFNYDENNNLKSKDTYWNNKLSERKFPNGETEVYTYDKDNKPSAIIIKDKLGLPIKKYRFINNGRDKIVVFDYTPDSYELTPDDIKTIKQRSSKGISNALTAFELKCKRINELDKEQVARLIKNIKCNSAKDGVELARYVDKSNIDLAELNNYIESIDFDNLYKLAPDLRFAPIKNILAFYDYHYKNDKITVFTKNDLTLQEDFTEYLSKNYVDADNMETLLTVFPCTNRNVGALPDDWTFGVSNSNLRTDVEAAIEKFRQKANTANHSYGASQKDIWELSNTLSSLLHKDVYIQFIGSGALGAGYKISVEGAEDVVLKIFHKKATYDMGDKHGQFIETQTGIFVNRNSDKFVPLLFGKVSIKQHQDGFYVTKYLTDDNTGSYEDTNLSNNKEFAMFAEDVGEDHNRRENLIMDFGEIYVVELDKYDL